MPTTASTNFTIDVLQPAAAPELAVPFAFPLTSGSYASGQVLGLVTATNRYAPYNDGAGDGRQVARGVLSVACTVDSSGNVSLANSAIGDEYGGTISTAPGYVGGYFRCEDTVGLDANAVADLGKLISGTTTSGLLRIT